MTLKRDTFCSFCGAAYTSTVEYPRTCTTCKTMVWANPIPVAVALVPIIDGRGTPAGSAAEGRRGTIDIRSTGLLVIRRAIPPGVGKLALPGGFVEETETWQDGGIREVREETGIAVAGLEPLWFVSTEPRPNRILLFGVAPPLQAAELPAFTSDSETSERGVIFGPDGLDEVFAFALHAEAARRYFTARGVTGPHAFTAR
jgi:ADP-ribose pyrophosphatase YjhB (NUDIX family)